MKSLIQLNSPDLGQVKQRPLDELRRIVMEAWKSVSFDHPTELIKKMPTKRQALTDAKERFTEL